MKTSDKHLAELAVAVHGGLLILHGLATLYHIRHPKRDWKHVAAHGTAALYSGFSLYKHINELKED